jgi:hypothetical protein
MPISKYDFFYLTFTKNDFMGRINRASYSMGIKGTIPIRPETLRPNKNYTVEEQLLLLYLLSLSPNWNLKKDWVVKMYNGILGRDNVNEAWAGLKLKGHLFMKRGKSFTDVYWIVYEIPPTDWNSVDQEPVDQESVDNNTEIKETEIKETDISRTSILDKSEFEKNPIENIEQIEKIRDDCAAILIKSNKFKVELFSFDHESKFNELENTIGSEEYIKVLPILKNWIWAKNLFNKYSSTTRRG